MVQAFRGLKQGDCCECEADLGCTVRSKFFWFLVVAGYEVKAYLGQKGQQCIFTKPRLSVLPVPMSQSTQEGRGQKLGCIPKRIPTRGLHISFKLPSRRKKTSTKASQLCGYPELSWQTNTQAGGAMSADSLFRGRRRWGAPWRQGCSRLERRDFLVNQ